jgi:putative ABC transport system permease protein
MKPFSALKFFKENKRKSVMTLVVLILSVCAISLITVLINSIPQTCSDTVLNPLEKFSIVYPLSGEYYLSDDAVTKLNANDDIERLIPADISDTSINLAIGGNTSVPVVFATKSDDEYLLDQLGDHIKQGRMPEDGKAEIAVQWQVMANKKWKLGQTVGSQKSPDEWMQGSYKIVGIIDGPNIAAVGTQSFRQTQYLKNGFSMTKPIGYIIIPKAGKLHTVNKAIDDMKSIVSFDTYESDKKMLDKALGGIQSTMTMIILIVVIILSISVATLMYLIYLQRSDEFGILTAMGYRKSFIRNLIIKEVASLVSISWLVGIALSFLMVYLLNIFVYNPDGNIIRMTGANVYTNTLTVPIMVSIFSAVPIILRLRRWDPITIIERRD